METKQRFRLLVCFLAGMFAFGVPAVVSAERFEDGSVRRGTPVPILLASSGDPQRTESSQGDGPRVEKWFYVNGLIVIVQDGYVIDSFIIRKD
jgi:hypothetical protein